MPLGVRPRCRRLDCFRLRKLKQSSCFFNFCYNYTKNLHKKQRVNYTNVVNKRQRFNARFSSNATPQAAYNFISLLKSCFYGFFLFCPKKFIKVQNTAVFEFKTFLKVASAMCTTGKRRPKLPGRPCRPCANIERGKRTNAHKGRECPQAQIRACRKQGAEPFFLFPQFTPPSPYISIYRFNLYFIFSFLL